jgi:hypothetical protein
MNCHQKYNREAKRNTVFTTNQDTLSYGNVTLPNLSRKLMSINELGSSSPRRSLHMSYIINVFF